MGRKERKKINFENWTSLVRYIFVFVCKLSKHKRIKRRVTHANFFNSTRSFFLYFAVCFAPCWTAVRRHTIHRNTIKTFHYSRNIQCINKLHPSRLCVVRGFDRRHPQNLTEFYTIFYIETSASIRLSMHPRAQLMEIRIPSPYPPLF